MDIRNLTPQQKCNLLGCTMDQLNSQYAANAQQLEKMYEKAVATGKKVNGYTAAQLDKMTGDYYKMATETLC